MKVRIADIKIGDRHRKDMGDIAGLAKSMNETGLIHPVALTPDYKLIAGERRILAAKMLGWTEIDANVIDLANLLLAERDENTARKEFTPSEAVAIGEALEPIERQAAQERYEQSRVGGNLPPTPAGKSLDKVAAAVGMSRHTYEKAKEIVAAAQDEPELFGDVLAQMDSSGSVSGAHREYRRRKDAQTIPEVVAPQGKYSTIVIDPPWDWADEGDVSQMGRGVPKYATMPIDEIESLPIPDLAADNCHLYLWVTNRSLPKAWRLFNAWGFRYITIVTWCKPSIGIGNYFRNNTEHLLFAIKGSMRLLRFDVGTWFEAARGAEHSDKPDKAYSLIASCSPGPRLDMFARTSREGFSQWGNITTSKND